MNKSRINGVVSALKPAGGVVWTYDKDGARNGTYYVSNFDPLAGQLTIGQKVSFKPTNPADGRNCAQDVKLLER